jgi:dihydroflavonol-4-reductase
MMRCLVTGATGFVGSNLVRDLTAAGHDVLATGAPGSTTRYLEGLPVEIVLADLTDPDALEPLVVIAGSSSGVRLRLGVCRRC